MDRNSGDYRDLIGQTADFVKERLDGEGSGHDWWHIERVWKMAIRIGQSEKANMTIVNLAALLHDIADHKFHDGDETIGPRETRAWLEARGTDSIIVDHVEQIVKDISFKGANVSSQMKSKEGMIVQDADRLDAMGAIGIARAFAYGGFRRREIYNPNIKTVKHETFEQYKKSAAPTINHFYEKLLLLKDLMNTETGRQIAEDRHKFMEKYLERFYLEWDGDK